MYAESIPQNAAKSGTPCPMCHKSPQQDTTYEITLFAGMVQVAAKSAVVGKHPGKGRGRIDSFSRRSRKRMIEKLTKKRMYHRPVFVTLTYPDEIYFDYNLDGLKIKHDLELMEKRFKRLNPSIGGIWRVEFETRKSGRFLSQIAPHFHLILDGYLGDMGILRKWVRNAWVEILRNYYPALQSARIDVQVAKSRRHAGYYVAKYVAKPIETIEQESNENEESICEIIHNGTFWTGRHWGAFGNWDVSEGLVVKLTREQFVEIRRTMRKWMKRQNPRFAKILAKMSPTVGFSMFGWGDELFKADGYTEIWRLLRWILVEI